MKLVTAAVKLDKLDDVVQAVSEAGARGLTATEVRGLASSTGVTARTCQRTRGYWSCQSSGSTS